ncbi:MAG: DUF6569 family protein [Bacteroidota bacterium]
MRYVCIFLLSCITSSLFGQFTYDNLMVDYGSAITYQNLQLVPIRAKDNFFQQQNSATQSARSEVRYTPLREAMERDLLFIRDRGKVNRLFIDNLSNEQVVLLSGEILRGGKQDRVIGQDMVLPPNTTGNRVPVFCVEEKRWSSPKQWSYYHEGSMHLRRVVDQSQNQSQIWREVAYELKQDNVSSKTRAYTSHSKNPQYAALEQEYLQAFALDSFPETGNIVGIVGMSGSVVIGCDIFISPELFQGEYAGLVFSYIDEAITFGLPVDITYGAIKQYCDKLLSNERMQRSFIQQYGKSFTYDGRIVHITTFNDRVTIGEYEALRRY